MPATKPIRLLLVEDEAEFRDTAAKWMLRQGHEVEQAAGGHEALRQLDARYFDVAVVDMNMPGMSGLELLQQIKERSLDTEVIILTGQAMVETAVAAMKLGAHDYLTKPFALAELDRRIRIAAQKSQLRAENERLKSLLARQRPRHCIVGESTRLQHVLRLIERVGPTEKAVLIEGESGTGKELVARALQQHSLRADKPFVTINCAALPDQLVESELFGHEKGAFTGAVSSTSGLFEVADGGTLFIDEIGELPLALQPKLLRVLEDGSLRRVGSHQERRVDVRIIAATNRNLQKEVEEGRFREDLFYRINVLSLVLPPLRERGDDIPLLIRHFLDEGWELEPEALQALVRYRWPGNVRQLSNVLQRAMILADDRLISVDDLPRELTSRDTGAAGLPAATTTAPAPNSHSLDRLDDLQKAHIVAMLEREHGNKARAARALGIHRRKLYRLLERYGLGPPG